MNDRLAMTIPECYDRFLVPVIFREPARYVADYVAALGSEDILETAAGTAILTREILDRAPKFRQYIASDLNGSALEVGRRKFLSSDKLEFQTCDATNLPFAHDSFDLVVCQFGLMLFPDRAGAYGSARRVLKREGRFVFTVWDSLTRNPFAMVLNRALSEFFPEDPPAYFQTPYAYHKTDVIRGALQENGFSTAGADVVVRSSPLGDPFEFATGFLWGTLFREELVRRGADPHAVCDHLARAFESELDQTISLRFLLFDGRRD